MQCSVQYSFVFKYAFKWRWLMKINPWTKDRSDYYKREYSFKAFDLKQVVGSLQSLNHSHETKRKKEKKTRLVNQSIQAPYKTTWAAVWKDVTAPCLFLIGRFHVTSGETARFYECPFLKKLKIPWKIPWTMILHIVIFILHFIL